MKLDFLTLYLVILLNSLMLCIVWAAFCYTHRNIKSARFWLMACLLTTAGGLLLTFDQSRALTVLGIALIVLGFCMLWTGIRSFYGMRALWLTIALILGGSFTSMVLAGDERASQNISYAGAQLIPMMLAFAVLVSRGRRSLGGVVSAIAIAIAIAGHLTEVSLNIMRLVGFLSIEAYYIVAAYLLVAVIFGTSLWNLGFLLMAIDGLRTELAQLAMFDELTGLPNRRQFLEIASQYIARVRRTNSGLALLLVDVDKFKHINDTFGHAAGDACLNHFADVVADRLGSGQTLARLSGDEFGIVMIETPHQAATETAERLVQLISASKFYWRGQLIPLSISIGVAIWHEGADLTLADFLEAADLALYEAKRLGRNRYAVACQLPHSTTSARVRLAAEQ